MKTPILIIILIVGIAINYWINRRRFYRRTVGGLEAFKSFENSVLTRLFEKILGLIAKLMVIVSLILLVVNAINGN